jgi:hypothetical protein
MIRGRPATGVTPRRNLRVPDDVWDAAKAKAAAEGTTVSAVIVAALREYAGLPRPTTETGPRGRQA